MHELLLGQLLDLLPLIRANINHKNSYPSLDFLPLESEVDGALPKSCTEAFRNRLSFSPVDTRLSAGGVNSYRQIRDICVICSYV